MSVNIGYFGLSLNTSNLSGDPYMNCFLSACTEVPAHVMSTLLLRNCPRRALLSSFLIIGGGFLLLVQFIPDCKIANTLHPRNIFTNNNKKTQASLRLCNCSMVVLSMVVLLLTKLLLKYSTTQLSMV